MPRRRQANCAFKPRGGAVVAELTEDDLVLPSDGAPARLTRAQETELPREVSIGYSDSGADYHRAAVSSRRLVGGAARSAHADLAVIDNDADIERRAEIWLQDLWAGREQAAFALPPSLVTLTPGDVVGLEISGRRRLIEIRETVEAGDRRITARTIDPDIFHYPVGAPRRDAPAQPVAIGPAHAVLLELPTLLGEDPPVLTWAAVFADPWPGTVAIWRSADGASFERIALAVAPAIIGVTLDAFPAGPVARWDRGSRVQVELFGGALASLSDADLLGGGNAAAVQRTDGSWEVLQFASAELIGENTYELSRLLRGQAGSEWAISDPLPAGAPFVLLDDQVIPVATGLDALGLAMSLRIGAARRGHGDDAVVELAVTPGPTALKPLAPVQVHAVRDGSGVTISWIRRTRRDGDSWSTAEVPLAEDSEAYEVDVMSGVTVLRTLTSTSPSVLYPAADETADFGSPQTSLTVRVCQLSASVARGIAAEAVLEI